MTKFTKKVIELIKQIPKGKVATYGQIANLAGNNKAARQISRILHSSSEKFDLPWHRVINSQGKISLRSGDGLEMQKAMLESEGIQVISDKIDLKNYQWGNM
ncbi:MAG: MGMT family protein [Candidatus Cloacimonadota bacterium]|nr:MGMT family protein [Candidatus Cloacimonadota bacterium]